jgi:hypothetical protein
MKSGKRILLRKELRGIPIFRGQEEEEKSLKWEWRYRKRNRSTEHSKHKGMLLKG